MTETEQLRGEIAAHKAAIRRHRSVLHKKKARLSELELEGRGIKLIVQGEGKGDPWPTRRPHC